MKVIDLLNKIANGEEMPKKIKYEEDIYIHIDNYCYHCEDTNLILSDRIFVEYSNLNDEIEIIEEDKKIEKLNLDKDKLLKNVIITAQDYVIEGKINELIDEVNKLKGENDDR